MLSITLRDKARPGDLEDIYVNFFFDGSEHVTMELRGNFGQTKITLSLSGYTVFKEFIDYVLQEYEIK